jgi:hypothetical protein
MQEYNTPSPNINKLAQQARSRPSAFTDVIFGFHRFFRVL